tara:strand:+ start:17557 stop:17784 length:228 start_codon:yes stop_codon:yes gene_type:complete
VKTAAAATVCMGELTCVAGDIAATTSGVVEAAILHRGPPLSSVRMAGVKYAAQPVVMPDSKFAFSVASYPLTVLL